jgi:hypothetical protein
VVLESAKDRILGVDTIGQHVPPRAWYKMACLLIRCAIGLCVLLGQVGMAPYFVTYLSSYSVKCLNHMVQEGTFVWETLALHTGTVCLGNCSKV